MKVIQVPNEAVAYLSEAARIDYEDANEILQSVIIMCKFPDTSSATIAAQATEIERLRGKLSTIRLNIQNAIEEFQS